MTRQLRLTDGWWREASGPMLGRTRSGRLVALLPKWTGSTYRFTDEDGTLREVSRRQMKDVLMPETYSFTKALPLQRMTKRQAHCLHIVINRHLQYALHGICRTDCSAHRHVCTYG